MFKNGGFLLSILVVTVLATVLIPTTDANHGCYKGYCWSWCGDESSGMWCYTTKGRKNDQTWVGCTSPADCDVNWQCANECHPKDYTK